MTTRVPAQPGLYDIEASPPALLGTRCQSCGRSFFPPLAIGCATCGSSELVDVSLPARGRLYSFATVHLHRGGGIEAPFTVGEIVLEAGPAIRAVMTGDEELQIGQPVEAQWVVTNVGDGGEEQIEPRFGAVR